MEMLVKVYHSNHCSLEGMPLFPTDIPFIALKTSRLLCMLEAIC